MRLNWRVVWAVLVGMALMSLPLAGSAAAAEAGIAILPPAITLGGPRARQRVLVERIDAGTPVGQLTEEITLVVRDPAIARLEGGQLVPVRNGQTSLVATLGKSAVTAAVEVRGMDQPAPWSFRNHVQSVLTKAGCNSGACHGALAGKNGFKLSLRGYNPQFDYEVLTHQARGRRVSLKEPAHSLLLLKPTTVVPHGGGRRIEPGSLAYEVLAEWIAAGAPPPRQEDPRISRIEVLPTRAILSPPMTQPLIVLAHFSDGRVEDVTHWAKYESTNAEVAQIDDQGRVTVIGSGEGAVTVWYLNQLAVATITVPYPQEVQPDIFAQAPRRNFIDELVLEKLQGLRVPPVPRSTDGEFLRRAYLDSLGVLPSIDEARAFLADGSADKRDRLIEHLLARPEFVDYWSYRFSDLLLVNSARLSRRAMWTYYDWVRRNVERNTPWDELVRQIVTARGSTIENGAGNFFVLHQDPLELSETISQAFLGMSITCAKCHNHPLEKWTNDQFYGMASLVARVRLKDGAGEGNFYVFADTQGEIVQPRTGQPQAPRPLDGPPVPFESPDDRRLHLAQWLTSSENPYFSKAIANRIWANYMGVGIVEKVDDLRLTNPASNPKLLDALSRHLVESGYDLRELMRTILRSETYQRSSVALPANAADKRFYSHYLPRRLMAEVMIDAIAQVTGVPTPFPDYPTGWRAMQLPDSNVASYFLDRFGRPSREITCDCERTNEPSMVQILHIANGDVINQKLASKGNRLDQQLGGQRPVDAVLDEIFLAALCRQPSQAERNRMAGVLTQAPPAERRAVLEDIYWSVLSSTEFLFNH